MPIRVTFVALSAYPVIHPEPGAGFGGREARAWLLARGLAKHGGFAVDFVVGDHGQPDSQRIQDVRVMRRRSRSERIRHAVQAHVVQTHRPPWLRFSGFSGALVWQLPIYAGQVALRRTRERLRGLAPALRQPAPDRFYSGLETDVFCCLGADAISAAVVASARATGRESVFLVASDADLDGRYSPDSTFVNPYGQPGSICYYPLAHADRVVVQTARQQERLRQWQGREAVIVDNPVDLDPPLLPDAEHPAWLQRLDRYALWVGRADRFHKRAQLCLELARRCPQTQFLLIMNPQDAEIGDRIREERPANLLVVDAVPYRLMPSVYRKASVLVSTSAPDQEGFPNTFLEAAAAGLPIASLEVDPAGFVTGEGCGFVAGGDLDRLASYLRALWRDPDRGAAEGSRGRDYVRAHHRLRDKTERLARILAEVVGSRP